MFVVAVISHHLRDGNRRGLWFWPFGSTPPLPYWLYISCTVALPFFIKEMKRSIDKIVVIPLSRQNSFLVDVWRNVNNIMSKLSTVFFVYSKPLFSHEKRVHENEREAREGPRSGRILSPSTIRRGNLKTEVTPWNASNVYRSRYNHRPFWIWVWGKAGQGNRIITVTHCFQKPPSSSLKSVSKSSAFIQ